MISAIFKTGLSAIRRDRGSLVLSFVLPLAFFSIFAVIFGGRRDSLPKVTVAVVDEDHSTASQQLVRGMQREKSLRVVTRPSDKNGVAQPDYTAATAETAVRTGQVPIAVIIPAGWGKNPIDFSGTQSTTALQLLKDPSDMVAPSMVAGLLQKVAMTSLPQAMAEQGTRYMDMYAGGLTPEQKKTLQDNMQRWNEAERAPGQNAQTQSSDRSFLTIQSRDVVGEHKDRPMISFYAAAIGVMFLLFTASGAGGSLLDEAESGTLDRVLSSRVTMTTLLAGKMIYCTTLAFAQLVLMFLWAWLVFRLDFLPHLSGFVVMGVCSAFAVANFGLLLASVCKTRAQLGALSTLLILVMSSIGGSMFPRFLMPPAMQKAGLLTINAWAIDGFTKVFWRDEPISHLWPQVAVLLGIGVVLFLIARRLARRWEYA